MCIRDRAGTVSGVVTNVTGSSPVASSGGSTPQISLSTGYGDTQNPYGSKSINTVLAGPAGGVSGSPTFRSLVAADIPGIGSTIQAWDADLDAIAALSFTGLAKRTGTNTWTTITDDSTNWNSAYTDRLKWDGGSSGLTPSTGRASLGATTVGSNIFTLTNPSATRFIKINSDNSVTAEDASTHLASLGATTVGENLIELTNPSAITFLRINADNTVTARSAANFRSDIGAGTGSGTVTTASVVSANGFAGTVANATTTPQITLTTTVTGLLSGNGTAISAASSGYGDTTNPYGSKTTNYVLAGPAGGPSASPSFRALVAADIPDLSGTYLSLGGGTMTGAITLRSGSNTSGTAPLYFSSSTNLLSTAVAGAMEYNNRALYFTPDISQGRALVSTPFYKMISSDTTVQFNVAPGVATTYSAFGTNGISLDTGSSYEVEMLLMLQASAASNSSTLIITPGSPSSAATPSASQFYYDYSDSTTVISSATATSGVLRTGTTTFPSLNTITIATGTTRYVKAFMKGIVRVGTGGNFTIRLAFAPTSPGTVTGNIYAGSYLKICLLYTSDAADDQSTV
jgi:hypothetical protein